MIVDASALFAVLNGEAEADRIAAALAGTRTRLMSAGTLLEAGIVAEASGPGRADDLDDLIAHYKIDIVPFTASQAALARQAFRTYGKGRHAARLNFGDCISYALARESGEPLLFKGDDFSQTDVEAATY